MEKQKRKVALVVGVLMVLFVPALIGDGIAILQYGAVPLRNFFSGIGAGVMMSLLILSITYLGIMESGRIEFRWQLYWVIGGVSLATIAGIYFSYIVIVRFLAL